MKKLIALLAALLVVFAACGDSGGSGGGEPDAGSAGSCSALADEGIKLIQVLLDEVSDLSLADLQSFDEDPPEAFTNLETQGEALSARQDELGCSDEEMSTLFTAKLGDLRADGQFAEFLLDSLKEDNPFVSP